MRQGTNTPDAPLAVRSAAYDTDMSVPRVGAQSADDRLPDVEETREVAVLAVDDCALHRDTLVAALAMNGIEASRLAWDLPSLITARNAPQPTVVLVDMPQRK